jgi:protein TonB
MNVKFPFLLGVALCSGHAFSATGEQAESAGPDATAKTEAFPKAKKPVKAKRKTVPAKKVVRSKSKPKAEKPPEDKAAIEAGTDLYKKELAQRIEQANADKVYVVRPQALLRSVVVVQFVVDANGKLVSSQIRRSNHDNETEASALASLRSAAPFPKPPAKLLRGGRLELHETWLFNDDGRFQIRSTAQQQIDQ